MVSAIGVIDDRNRLTGKGSWPVLARPPIGSKFACVDGSFLAYCR
jgi:hypothetical protein